jgi:magnesium chelatase accessory protein
MRAVSAGWYARTLQRETGGVSGPVHPDWDSAGADWPNREASFFEEIGPVRWHVQRAGRGPVLLLLHGTGAATHSWRDLLPLLAEHFDVIAPDLPGHGFTRIASRQQCSLPAMAGAITGLVQHLGAKPDVVVGHSAGAAIALQALLFDGLKPARVIGLNPALKPFRGLAGAIFPPLAKMLALNPFVPWAFSSLAGGPSSVKNLIDGTGSKIDERGLAFYQRLIARSDHVDGALAMMALWSLDAMLEALPGIDVPVDLIVGEGDRTIPPEEALEIAARNPGITAHRIVSLGHLMHEEEPQRFADLIRKLAMKAG